MRYTKESSGERLSSSKRLSQGKEKVSDSFGYLALGGPGRQGCPRLTLHEELHSLGHLSRSAEGVPESAACRSQSRMVPP
jgi:hypothetical protein